MGNVEDEEASVDRVKRDYTITINAPGSRIRFKLDTGADVTVIGADQMHYFGKDICTLQKTAKNLSGLNGIKIECLEIFNTQIRYKNKLLAMYVKM